MMSNEFVLAIVGASSGAIGAVAGVGSLAWQVRTHRQSGRVVELKISNTLPTYDDPRVESDWLILIEVFNKGGAPVTVTNLGISLGPPKARKNVFVTWPQPQWLSTLPAIVEPGGTPAQFGVPAEEIRKFQAQNGIPFDDMRPWVDLGDGRRVYSKSPVPLA